MVWYYPWTGVGGWCWRWWWWCVCGQGWGGAGARRCRGAARYGLARIQCLIGNFANASGGRSPTRMELAPTSPPVAVNGGVLLSVYPSHLSEFDLCAPVATPWGSCVQKLRNKVAPLILFVENAVLFVVVVRKDNNVTVRRLIQAPDRMIFF